MTKKLKFALFGNVHQERKSAAVQKFLAIATERKAELAMPEPFYLFLRDNMKIHVPDCEIIKFLRFATEDSSLLVDEAFANEVHGNLHHSSTCTFTVTSLEEP